MTGRNFKHKHNTLKNLILATMLLLLFLTGCSPADDASPSSTASSTADGCLKVHFIDVGQGDSILAEADGHFLLVDAGENDQRETVVSYLKKAGVHKLDYVIGTHPHSDHIGGLDDVLNSFPTDTLILPPKEHTTKTFEDVLDAAASQNLKLTKPIPGTSYPLGNSQFTILSPLKDYGDDLNNWSVGIRLVFNDTSFVMCGDAEELAETDMVNSGEALSADVLKAGHHGSSTSSCEAFLKKVSPSWAVIQCGKDNSYGHPHAETLEVFQKDGIQILRTDQLGTIVASSDGTSITWSCSSGKELPNASTSEDVSSETASYILNSNTKKFHLPGCSSVSQIQEANRKEFTGTRKELLDQGFSPCGQCRP